MATVYGPPEGFDPPSFDVLIDQGYQAYSDANEAYIKRLADAAREDYGKQGDLVGEIIRFQIADGYAEYMVWSEKPLQLIHLPFGDAYAIPEAHARGLRLSDVREQVAREKRIRELFASKS